MKLTDISLLFGSTIGPTLLISSSHSLTLTNCAFLSSSSEIQFNRISVMDGLLSLIGVEFEDDGMRWFGEKILSFFFSFSSQMD
jgi:hypothetical protein